MTNLRKIFRESFYTPTEKSCVLEFTYPQLKQIDIDETMQKFTELLKRIHVDYSNNYNNINKVLVICPSEKADDVKAIAESIGLVLQKELLPDPRESSHL